MKALPNLVLLLSVSLLFGCGSRHRLESQLLRPHGVLSVGVQSDTPGEISTTADTNPRVTVLLGKKDELTVEQAGNETSLRIRGTFWNRIPQESRRLDVHFQNQEFLVQVDGVPLPKNPQPETIAPAETTQPAPPHTNQPSSTAPPG